MTTADDTLPEPADALQAGAIVGGYRIEEPLGPTSAGTRVRVRHLRLGTLHALEVLELDGDTVARCRAWAAVRHRCVVAVTDVIAVGGRTALVLERGDAPTAEEWALGGPDQAQVLAVVRDVLSGLDALHERGTAHGGVGLRSALVSEGPTGTRARLVDPGLARTDAESADDLRDAGALLWRLLAPGARAEDWPASRALVPTAPDGVHEVLERCLGGTPTGAAELIGLLEAPEPEPEASPPPTRRGAARPLAALALSGGLLGFAGLVALVGAIALTAALWPDPEPEPPVLTEGPCPGVAGQVVGYAYAGRRLELGAGDVWEVPRDVNVREAAPSEENGWDTRTPEVCVLRKGTKLRLDREPLQIPRAVWVPVVAGSLTN